MKLLVTGATGFVGSQLIARWAGRDYQIKALVRDPHRCPELQRWPVEICQGDVNAPETLRPAVAGVDAIIHLASRVGESGDREEFFRVNVEGTRNLFEACRGLPLRRFVHVSSLSVITGYREHEGTKEDAPYLPTGENYADSKIEAEKLALEYGRKAGFPVTVLRPGFIYGPRDRTLLPTVAANLKRGVVRYVSRGRFALNTTYVGNLVDAIFLAVDKSQAVGQIFNLTDGEMVSKRRFIEALITGLNLPKPPPIGLPLWIARLFAWNMERQARKNNAPHPPRLTQARLKFLGLNLDFSIAKAQRELGYQPRVPFDQGIQQTIAWYKDKV